MVYETNNYSMDCNPGVSYICGNSSGSLPSASYSTGDYSLNPGGAGYSTTSSASIYPGGGSNSHLPSYSTQDTSELVSFSSPDEEQIKEAKKLNMQKQMHRHECRNLIANPDYSTNALIPIEDNLIQNQGEMVPHSSGGIQKSQPGIPFQISDNTIDSSALSSFFMEEIVEEEVIIKKRRIQRRVVENRKERDDSENGRIIDLG